jgi:hypothetical protein
MFALDDEALGHVSGTCSSRTCIPLYRPGMGRTGLLAAACLALLTATTADAHFNLMAPTSKTVQNATGDPQKTAPCGGAGTASNMVTNVTPGGMLTVTINETVTHPGHYRISVAQTEAGLPPPPVVTGANCGQAAINANPTLPVLKDGVFVHTAAFSGPQTAQIQLPAGYECQNCVVQVLEFMSQHSPPCFYHHCATVNISNTVPTVDGPPTGGPDAGIDPTNDTEGGCCDTRNTSPLSSLALSLFALAFILRRRR